MYFNSCGLDDRTVHCRPVFPYPRPACQHPAWPVGHRSRRWRSGRWQAAKPCRCSSCNARAGNSSAIRERLFSTNRADSVASVAGAGKELGSAFASFKVLRLRPRGRALETTHQKRDRRKNARSARHSLFSRCGKRFQRSFSKGWRRHLLADYPANGSALVTKPRDRGLSEYLLCIQCISGAGRSYSPSCQLAAQELFCLVRF